MTNQCDPSGDYYASLLVESESQGLDHTGLSVGFDLGQIDLLIGSDGTRFNSLKTKEIENKLVYWQKKQSRRMLLAKEKGIPLEEAKNYQKAKQMVAKYYKKIRNIRDNYLHHVSKYIVSHYDKIALEDIKVKNLLSNPNNTCRLKRNNRKLSHQSWYKLRKMLTYKCEWYGKDIDFVSPQYTSKDCSNCGYRKDDLTLSDLSWQCPSCLIGHDRDINAANNILNKSRFGTNRGNIG